MVRHSLKIAWAAGVFEGEGCISRHSANNGRPITDRPAWSLTVSMTDLDVLQRLYKAVRAGRINGPYAGVNKPKWQWAAGSRADISKVLKLFLPFLCKRRAAKARQCLKEIKPLLHVRRGRPARSTDPKNIRRRTA